MKLPAIPPFAPEIQTAQPIEQAGGDEIPAAMAGGLRERLSRGRLGKTVAVLGAAALVAVGGGVTESAPVHADVVTYQVFGTDGEGLYIHPNAPTLSSETGGLMPDGANFSISCWTVGDNVEGDAVWDYGTDDRGRVGYVADAFVNTPYILNADTSGLASAGLPECGSEGSGNNDSSQSGSAVSVPTSPPSTPNYVGNCAQNVGVEALEAWDSVFEMWNEDGELVTQLERWDTLWGSAGEDDVCVGAQLSNPNPAHNDGEYISSVVGLAPDIEPDGCSDSMLIEVWGNGFYRSANCSDATEWHPNVWLNAGSWICAAISSAYDIHGYASDTAAAEAVDDGTVKLGAADPLRTITCTEVK